MTHNSKLDVQQFLDANPVSSFQWRLFAFCFLIMLLDGFDTAAIGYVAPSLIGEWGISKAALSPVLSAALFGLSFGALMAGPLADRFGRKRLICASVALFGGACLVSATASSLDELAILRFITGLGLGAAMPNAITLMSEFVPTQRRSLLINAMFCGFPLGAALGGFLAAWMIPHWGWRSVFGLGGVTPLLLLVFLLLTMPESVRYMVTRGFAAERIRAVLRKVSASLPADAEFVQAEAAPASAQQGGLGLVLSRSYLLGTVMLWIAYFMGLVIFYALINWMPLLLKDTGMPAAQATLITALFPLGGIGALLSGWLMDRHNANRVVAIFYGITALSIFLIGQVSGQTALLVLVVLAAGVFMNTAQSSMGVLAASFYPTTGRASGVAWMLGIGRFGGIAGSFLVGILAQRQLPLSAVFSVIAIAGALAALALLIKQRAEPASSQQGMSPIALGDGLNAH